MVRDLLPHGIGRLGGPDIHAAIDLHRINGNDFATTAFRDRHRHVGFTGSSGPQNGDRNQDTTLPNR